MAEAFSKTSGSPKDIIYFDKEEIDAAFSSVDFNLNMERVTYATEIKIKTYIDRLFTFYEGIQTTWNNAKASINSYTEEGESIPEANSPEGLNDFETEPQEESDVASEITNLQGNPVTSRKQNEDSFKRSQSKEGKLIEEQRLRDEEAYEEKQALEEKQQRESYKVNTPEGGNLNVRSGPGQDVQTSIPNNTELKVIGESEDGKWIQVNYKDANGNTKNGWVYKDFTTQSNQSQTSAIASSNASSNNINSRTYAVNTPEGGNLNLRGGPSTKYGVYTSIPNNTELKVTGFEGNWAQVEYQDIEGITRMGYVYKDYLKELK